MVIIVLERRKSLWIVSLECTVLILVRKCQLVTVQQAISAMTLQPYRINLFVLWDTTVREERVYLFLVRLGHFQTRQRTQKAQIVNNAKVGMALCVGDIIFQYTYRVK